MGYVTEIISDKLLEDTRKAWELVVGVDEFSSEYGALFEWLASHRDYEHTNGCSVAYALVQEGHKIASAFIEIVTSKNLGGLTKLLKVFITPQFWDVADHQTEVVHLFIAAVKSVVEISNDQQSRTIKIFGRSNSLLSLLHSIHVAMINEFDSESGIVVRMQARWLVITCG